MKILITGGAGFIGSHVVRLFVTKYPNYQILNLDALTYAGNLENLRDIEKAPNYQFIKGDIADQNFIDQLFANEEPDAVIHLAAESHVDRSITDPMAFVKTNVIGTVNLLNAARHLWQPGGYDGHVFYHVSTDEVYGSLDFGPEMFTEETSYDPRSPYSASKASSDHFVRAWHHTYGLPIKLSNCSNNYGPNHFPEKLIPLAIHRLRTGQPVPVYGKGENVRDWLFVKDHATAIDAVFHRGKKRRHLQHRRRERVAEPQAHRAALRRGGPENRPGPGHLAPAHQVRDRPRRPRHALRHRLLQNHERAGLEAVRDLRAGPGPNRGLVPRKRRMAEQRDQRCVPGV